MIIQACQGDKLLKSNMLLSCIYSDKVWKLFTVADLINKTISGMINILV